MAQTPTFLSDDEAQGECVRRRRGEGEREGKEERVPRLHGETDRQQGTAAALDSRRISLHCDLKISIISSPKPK